MSFISFEDAIEILKSELKFPQERAIHFVKRFDHNRDGRLSADEFRNFRAKIAEIKSQLGQQFKKFDKDGNGYISLKEASEILSKEPFNFPASKQLVLLRQFDRDGNGKLDIEEFSAFYAEIKATNEEVAARFEQLDADRNGVLSPAEIISVLKDTLGLDDDNARQLITMFDTNKDGNLDKTEFMALWSEMFG